MSAAYWLFPDSYAAFDLPSNYHVIRLWYLFGCLYGGLWLHLLCIFPRPLVLVQRHRWAIVLCYLPTALIFLISLNRFWLHGLLAPGLAQWYETNLAISLVDPVPILLSIGVLIYRFRNNVNRLETRQVRLILWATAAGIVLNNIESLLEYATPMWYYGRWYHATSVSIVHFTAILLGPLAFAYAFRKYRLMDVEGKLKRATRNALLTGTLILVLVGITYGLSQIMLVTLGVTSRTPSMALAFVMALGIFPVQQRLHRLVEQRLYPERLKLRQMLQNFLQQSSTLSDQHTFWQELQGHLKDGLQVDAVYPVLKDNMPPGFSGDSTLVAYLAQDQRPLLVDEALGSGRVEMQEAEIKWLTDRQIGLLLPLVLHRELIGVLAIGLRPDQEDYDAEELQILNSLAPQIAIASENQRLLEENVVKRDLEHQLQMARRIQQGFLPQQIPPTPGLEVVAISRFCLDVAGDYYDVVPLKDSRTVLAIGDVSGKGAGAALIMANLQAALRTAVRMNVSLPETVSEINNLICQNTPTEQYITFFVAIFNPATLLLTYVNAGHNAPLLIHHDGSNELLEIGGTVLGVLSELTFRQGTVPLAKDDLLLFYTDGASEAMNEDEEEFGEGRILRFLKNETSRRPQEILQRLEAEVIAYHGTPSFDDDFTLLLARVVDTVPGSKSH
jgi:sigma-B regulation protein RsbU (phosphoserine phosphatase)